jgi:signal transduction histidine kinase
VRRHGDLAEITVADTGGGVPEAIRAKIYDPFFTTKGVGKGTGQGLYIAREIVVRKHHGTIDLASEPGRGACFTIRIPIDGNGEA